MSTVGQIYDLGAKESFELKVNDDTRTQLGRGFYGSTYLLFVTDTTDGVCVKKIARCKFVQI